MTLMCSSEHKMSLLQLNELKAYMQYNGKHFKNLKKILITKYMSKKHRLQ